MKASTSYAAALLLAVSLLSAGCRNTSANKVALWLGPDGAVQNQVMLDNPGFAKSISFEKFDLRQVGNMLQAQVALRNQTKGSIEFFDHFEWQDADGFPIESTVGGWQAAWIEGRETKLLVGTAASTKAQRVVVHIRRAP